MAKVDASVGSEYDLTVDHEKFAGEVIPDPWEDDDQTDWENNPVGGDEDGVGSDA